MKIKDALKLLKPELEARMLLSYVIGFSQEYIIGHSEDELTSELYDQFLTLIERRKKNEPIAYIIGKKEFYGRDFLVSKDVLIPRSDSETLIDTVLEIKKDGVSILELGVGSGCLVLTLLSEIKNSTAVAVDISAGALEIAKQNAKIYGLQDRCEFIKSDWFDNVIGKFDVIISNPPYIEQDETKLMSDETLRYEPKVALFGGLVPYKIIASQGHDFLEENGKIYLEIGLGKEIAVEEIFLSNGYRVISKHRDLENRIRVMVFALDR